jgi:6-phospho-beta-glucosidase
MTRSGSSRRAGCSARSGCARSAAETIAALGERPRGAYLLEQQAGFYAAAGEGPEQALARWRAAKDERDRTYMAEARNGHHGASAEERTLGEDEPGGYEAEALAVVEAIAGERGAVRILNVANRSALPFLDERAVIEVPCVVSAAGVRPIAVGQVPDHARALIDTVKAVERATIEAALTGSTALAVKALALHPLVPSVTAARAIFAEYRERLPALEKRFA